MAGAKAAAVDAKPKRIAVENFILGVVGEIKIDYVNVRKCKVSLAEAKQAEASLAGGDVLRLDLVDVTGPD